MNRKVAAAVITCVIAGIGIYLASKRIREKKLMKRSARQPTATTKSGYAYEYTL